MDLLISIVGIFVLLGIGLLFSNNRKAINFRTIFGALAIQIGFAALILYVPAGRNALLSTAEGVSKVINYGNEGIAFLFGNLSDPSNVGFIFAFKVLPIIVFFSALISVLYYIGVMQWVIKIIGGGLQKTLGTSKAESMSAAANIFVGQTEAPLVVKPFISRMTESELFTVMVGGTASIAGSVLAGYAGMGVPLTYLIAASFMAAPAGLLFAKLMYPQTEKFSDTLEENVKTEKPNNIVEALANGAASGVTLAINVGGMLIAFIASIALLNGLIGGIGGWFGYGDLTLQSLLGYLFQPIAFIIGVPWQDAEIAGQMIGMKLAVNEFVGYLEFAKYLQPDSIVQLSDKTKAIITFALCGFANFSAIAVLIGGIGSMAPTRRSDIARLGLKAVIAGTLANLMSATIAGFFIELSGSALS
ncbi:NupC/NupG family nucleoside CNT transporter [Avibacterium paragallinarum]|uniref:Nucleoside permease n=1 Tax=Avibacterium paragallinarum TaxID=728 RepID=A0AAE5WIN7_AVIPA|nr:NupC/NupG family nucleoside CNT transporter [Avibacterium paragallinarum]MEE3608589.1 NupC/NupG family nucleoside CNT transporter [Avibacterium paragallinarum]MEE3621641.1 NupC/NupG family nucleoside CNT transporter [Avibacterium paragallinarum]MEE3668762.1 NupC/NupG family nucleoside CNT transporter [Avibacterium paragallinarum]MEE3680282.1 NupC/NupG family nucleoside CNT transporter [Avibacterium paragallinarum]MEE4385381.1 NupC/NupG family nucleoside CNT transporter [Avibacterium paragal